MSGPKIVQCPQCGAAVVWGPQSPFRPFCSERCRQIDLGAWASGSYCVPAEISEDVQSGEFAMPAISTTPHE